MRSEGYHSFNLSVLFETLDVTEKVALFYLLAVAEVEFGAEYRYHNRRYQIPPFYGSIHDSNRPVYHTSD